MDTQELTTWIEISKRALANNICALKEVISDGVIVAPCVKANAYGHGLVEASKVFLDAGAHWLCVATIEEAESLRAAGISVPIYILGYVTIESLYRVIETKSRIVVYNTETIQELERLGKIMSHVTPVHIKVETGTNRQGVPIEDALVLAQGIQDCAFVSLEGITMHFANVEDSSNGKEGEGYRERQLRIFNDAIQIFKDEGIKPPIRHCGNSATTMLYPDTHMGMVRFGIACYGMWPSKIIEEQYHEMYPGGDLALEPAFTWKTRIAQIKNVAIGEKIGYGCTYETERETMMAVLPIGYADGYDRKVSNMGYVLVAGKQAKLLGRVCMNTIMVDVTDIPGAKLEDEVVLIGKQGLETISAELFASWCDRINYEYPTRITSHVHGGIARVVVE